MLNRENAVGLALLLLCALTAAVLIYSIVSGTRFHLDGPSWLGMALAALFIGAAIYGFVSRPGRRWPWQKDDR